MQAVMETIFDIVYLCTVIALGVRMIAGAGERKQIKLFGIMAVVLGCGDAFHLVPRAYALCTDGLANHAAALGFGKLVTSVTMTVFYVILYYIWKMRYRVEGKNGLTAAVWGLAIVRIFLCFMPGNDWLSASAPLSWGIYRNIPLLPEGKKDGGFGLWLHVAGDYAQLRILYSGCALGGHHPGGWCAYDPQDLRLRVDRGYGIPGDETDGTEKGEVI